MIVERLDPGQCDRLANNTNSFICGARASIQSARSIVLRGGLNYGGLRRDDGAPAAAAAKALREDVHLRSLTVCGQAVPMHGFCSDELSRVVPTLVGLPKPHEAT